MKILHAIFSKQFYGSERHCIELAVAQAEAGHDITILIQGSHTYCASQFWEAISALQAKGSRPAGAVRLIAIPSWCPAILYRPLAWLLLRSLKPDVVHTHLNPAARRLGAVAHGIGTPHIATLHIRYDYREHRSCDGLICGASWQRAAIQSEFTGAVTTIWAWLPAVVQEAQARLHPDAVRALRCDWNAKDNTMVFGSVGRFVPEKGMDLLVSAFRAAFARDNEGVRLVLVGLGPGEEELRRASADDPRIVLLTEQGEIAPCYGAFDVYVSAARFEPFGLTILEAMNAGCPLIVTRTEGPSEFLRDDRVLWAELNDEVSLTEQLRLAAAKGNRQRYSYDLSPFARDKAVQAIEEFYHEVITKTRKRCAA